MAVVGGGIPSAGYNSALGVMPTTRVLFGFVKAPTTSIGSPSTPVPSVKNILAVMVATTPPSANSSTCIKSSNGIKSSVTGASVGNLPELWTTTSRMTILSLTSRRTVVISQSIRRSTKNPGLAV